MIDLDSLIKSRIEDFAILNAIENEVEGQYTVDELIVNGSFYSDLDKYTSLDISGYKITKLNGIEKFVNLERLFVSNNLITSLVPLGNLKNLKFLNCAHNNIETLNGIENLKNLKLLNCAHNNIETLNVGAFTKLEILNVSNNYLEELKGLKGLHKLQQLNCENNYLIHLKEFTSKILKFAMFDSSYIRKYKSSNICYCVAHKQLIVVFRKEKKIFFNKKEYSYKEFLESKKEFKIFFKNLTSNILSVGGKRTVKFL